jgi:hypothetical protein
MLALAAAFECRASAAAVDPAQAAGEIDAIMTRHWSAKHLQPNPPASDELFVRRIYLDLAGRIPTVRETEEFLAATDPQKRSTLITKLLAGEGYVQRYYQVWADVLRLQSKARLIGRVTGAAYDDYLKNSLRTNKPYDQFVRELITAKGRAWENGAIGFYMRDNGMPLEHAALTARVFLGTRIECAQCHDHPFDTDWTQMKFYQIAAFTYGFGEGNYYGRIGLREAASAREKSLPKEQRPDIHGIVAVLNELQGPFLGNNSDLAYKVEDLKLPHDYQYGDAKPFDIVKPAVGFGKPAVIKEPGFGVAEAYADWVTSRENPRFTTVVTNRLWKSVFGRALIEPLDDLHEKTAADIPELQEYLNRLMISQGYDLKAFLNVLVRTRAYQAQASRAEWQPGEPYDFTGPLLRRMTAEQIYDSFVTLIRPSPDQNNPFAREDSERAIREALRADALFRAFPPTELYDRAAAASSVLKEQAAELKALQVKINAARKAGDTELATKLGKQTETIQRKKWQTINDQVILPMLAKLPGKPAEPIATTGRNAITETVRAARVPGIDDKPLASEDPAVLESLRETFRAEAAYFGIPAAQFEKYADARVKQLKNWPRSADLESPAPRGHYLRDFGQSDRETIDNSNPDANISQALLLMNSDLVPQALGSQSQLKLEAARTRSDDAKTDVIYLAILSRKPTAKERQIWTAAHEKRMSLDDLAAALLNSHQFLFVQ